MTENNRSILIDYLVEQGEVTETQKQELFLYADEHQVDITKAITESNIIGDKSQIIRTIASTLDLDFVNLAETDIQQEALDTITKERAIQLCSIPFAIDDNTLYVAVPIEQSRSFHLKDDLRRETKKGFIKTVIATKPDILKHIDKMYRSDAELRAIREEERNETSSKTASEADYLPDEIAPESKVVRFVDLVLKQAVKDGVSDIHFDPQEHGLDVRYRIDGILRKMISAPTAMIPAIVSRIKILSNLDISKTRETQDGRLEYSVDKKPIDFRVATLPAIYGEKIVMRILDNSSTKLSLEDLGFSSINLERFREAAHKPYGVVLVTGPTGSGKSTTLYAALNELNSPEVNIITAEDPVEYQLPGITQVAVHHNLTFDSVLRTVLRADPDIILIGEIRDKVTAEIAMKAGMTGHMVFSTLHTNDASSALTRLGDMGVAEFITGSTVEGIASQRLVRRLCKSCKIPYEPTELELEKVGFNKKYWDETQPYNFHKPALNGCKECSGKGYKGRVAIHEVLLLTEVISEAVIKGAKAIELHKLSVEGGMIPLKDDGHMKACKGDTTLSEITRVVA